MHTPSDLTLLINYLATLPLPVLGIIAICALMSVSVLCAMGGREETLY
jgi:hypothetical protein